MEEKDILLIARLKLKKKSFNCTIRIQLCTS